jgi:hypothetical protein
VALDVAQGAKAPIGNRTEARLGNVPLEVYCVLKAIEARMIESIEHLGTELNAILLFHSPVFVHREINVIDWLSAY